MELYKLIKPMGMAAYTVFLITILIGLFMKKIKLKNKFKLHKFFALTGLLLATIHFILIILYA